MNKNNFGDEVIILGGGISGLAMAWYLYKAGIPFKLLEKNSETGGMISSSKVQGSVMDFGPNSLRDRDGTIRGLADELGILDDIIQISEAFKTRYIVRNKNLQELTPSPKTLFTNRVISGKGKLRLLTEPFMPKGTPDDESIGDFLERRIGKEAVEYLVDPIFSGIYAGDIYQMSKKFILPKLDRYEQEFGSLLWGAIRSKKDKKSVQSMVLTFREGIQQLTNAITDQLSQHIIHEEVQSLRKSDSAFEVKTADGVFQTTKIVSCLPAYTVAQLLEGFDPQLSATLSDIDYAPMLSTQVIFDTKEVNFNRPGFGFLIPRKEDVRLLGAIWKSSIFPELTSKDKIHFTLMTGGAHDRAILSDSVETVEAEVLQEFSQLTGIESHPEIVRSRLWRKAIPQFTVGYEITDQKLREIEKEYPGLYLGGNYRWGVSVPDCIKGAKSLTSSLFQ